MQMIYHALMVEMVAEEGMELVREADGLRGKKVYLPANCSDVWSEAPEVKEAGESEEA